MKDGWYLSTFLAIDELSNLLDIHIRKNQNISLWKKSGNQVELIHYWELERISGIKHHGASFRSLAQAKELINDLLKAYHLRLEDINEIWGTPGLGRISISNDKKLANHAFAHVFSNLTNASLFRSHPMIHLSMYKSPDPIMDPDKNRWIDFYVGAVSINGKFVDFFPVCSPESLWAIVRRHYQIDENALLELGMRSRSQAYWEDETTLEIFSDRSNERNEKLQYLARVIRYVEGLSEQDAGVRFNFFDSNFSERENKISMVVKIIHAQSCRMMERNIEQILDRFSLDPAETILSLSGDYNFNYISNSYLIDKYKFKQLVASPFVNDSGISMGIALWNFYNRIEIDQLQISLHHVFYGDDDPLLEDALKDFEEYIEHTSDYRSEMIVQDIIREPIIWFNGRAEIGQLAPGNRCILGDPRFEATKESINRMKLRERWHSISSIILDSQFDQWMSPSHPTPYMLHEYVIHSSCAQELSAITHKNKASKVQCISRSFNEDLYEVLLAYYQTTNLPILCCESIADANEPVVNSIRETLDFALRKGIRICYLNKKRITLKASNAYQSRAPCTRKWSMERMDEEERARLIQQLNPHHVPVDYLKLLYHIMPEMLTKIDFKSESSVNRLYRVMGPFLQKANIDNIL